MVLLEVVLAQSSGEDLCVGFFLAEEKGDSGVFRRVEYEGSHLLAESYDWWNTRIARRSHVCVHSSQPAFSLNTHADVQIDLPTIAISSWDSAPRIHWHKHCETVDAQSSKRHLNLDQSSNPVCTVDLTAGKAGVQFIHFGFDNTQRPVCLITDASYGHDGKTNQLDKLRSEIEFEPPHKKDRDFRDLVWLATKIAHALPTQTTLRNAEVDYLFSFPWNRFTGRTLIPHAAHLGCWAVIGNTGQDLHFVVDTDTARQKHVYELLGIGSVPSMHYAVRVSFVKKTLGSTSTWRMNIEMHDEPLPTFQHDIRPETSLFTSDSTKPLHPLRQKRKVVHNLAMGAAPLRPQPRSIGILQGVIKAPLDVPPSLSNDISTSPGHDHVQSVTSQSHLPSAVS